MSHDPAREVALAVKRMARRVTDHHAPQDDYATVDSVAGGKITASVHGTGERLDDDEIARGYALKHYIASGSLAVGDTLAVRRMNDDGWLAYEVVSEAGIAPGAGLLPTGGVGGDILLKKSATNYDTEWRSYGSRKVQRAGMQGGFSSAVATTVPAFAQSFAVVPGDYVLVMEFSGFYNPASAVAYWLDYQTPDGGFGQSPGASFFFNQANIHAMLPPLSVDLTVTTAGTLKVWPQWGGLSDNNDRCEFLLIPKDVQGPTGPAGPNTMPPAEGFSGRATNNFNPIANTYDWTAIGLGIERLDTGGTHDGPGVGARWTVHRTGWFQVSAHGAWDINASGSRSVQVKNITTGQTIVASETVAVAARYTQHSASAPIFLTIGQVVEFQASQLGSAAIVGHKYDSNTDGSGMDLIYLGS